MELDANNRKALYRLGYAYQYCVYSAEGLRGVVADDAVAKDYYQRACGLGCLSSAEQLLSLKHSSITEGEDAVEVWYQRCRSKVVMSGSGKVKMSAFILKGEPINVTVGITTHEPTRTHSP